MLSSIHNTVVHEMFKQVYFGYCCYVFWFTDSNVESEADLKFAAVLQTQSLISWN